MIRTARRLLPTSFQQRVRNGAASGHGRQAPLASTYSGVPQPVYPGSNSPYSPPQMSPHNYRGYAGVGGQSQSSVYNSPSSAAAGGSGWESISLASFNTLSSVSGYYECSGVVWIYPFILVAS